MRLSTDPDYLEFGRCVSQKRYNQAIDHLERVLARSRQLQSAADTAMLLQCIGEVHFFADRIDCAISYFESADEAADRHPHRRWAIAQFWLDIAERPDLALHWANRIVSWAEESQPTRAHRSLGRLDYVALAQDMISVLSDKPT